MREIGSNSSWVFLRLKVRGNALWGLQPGDVLRLMNVIVNPASNVTENVSNATATPDDTKCSLVVKVEQF